MPCLLAGHCRGFQLVTYGHRGLSAASVGDTDTCTARVNRAIGDEATRSGHAVAASRVTTGSRAVGGHGGYVYVLSKVGLGGFVNVLSEGLGGAVVGDLTGAQQVRDQDSGQDANDGDDDQQLDQGKTGLLHGTSPKVPHRDMGMGAVWRSADGLGPRGSGPIPELQKAV